LLTGESSLPKAGRGLITVFQSTPVIANGRIDALGFGADALNAFQSTPVIANGRIREWVKP